MSSATLTIFVNRVYTAGAIDIAEVDSSWSESLITNGTMPSISGVNINPTAVAVGTTDGFITVDVTSAVQDWLNNSPANYGLVVKADSGSPLTALAIDSKESTATSHPAVLNIVLVGPAGPAGPSGTAGAAGPTGATGATGATGPSGPSGASGVQGPVGPSGASGVQGPVGPSGASGVQGPVGPSGASGVQGPVGPSGASGVQGPVGPSGASGVQGPVGPSGASGVQGPVGPSGASGVQGPVGPSGLQGLTGASGVQGPAGPSGLQGLTGASGVQGPAGPSGASGLQGPAGPSGASGLQGPAGPSGVQGAQGAQGLTGASGPAGPTGATGPSVITNIATVYYTGSSATTGVLCPSGLVALGGGGYDPTSSNAHYSGDGPITAATLATALSGTTTTVTLNSPGLPFAVATGDTLIIGSGSGVVTFSREPYRWLYCRYH